MRIAQLFSKSKGTLQMILQLKIKDSLNQTSCYISCHLGMNRRGTVGYYSNAINATLHEILLEIFSQMSLFGVDKTCKIERLHQRYTYRVLQTIQMKFILL